MRAPKDRALAVLGVVATVGLLVALGAAGVRRYLESARLAECKNTVGSVALSVALSWERMQAEAVARGEDPAGAHMCPSAEPGDAEAWKCLGLNDRSARDVAQVRYTLRSDDEFEVSAFCTDRAFTRVSRSGQLVNGHIVLATRIFVESEFE